jgi:glycosidase
VTTVVTVAGATVTLDFDESTGMLAGLALPAPEGGARVPVTVAATLTLGGREQRGPTGGIEYVDTLSLSGSVARAESRVTADGDDAVVTVPTTIDDWRLDWVWRLHADAQPGVSLTIELTAPETGERVLRGLELRVEVATEHPEGWVVDAPGNMLRRSVAIDDLPPSTGIEPPGGSRGSSGIVRLATADDLSLVLWPLCTTELADIVLRPTRSDEVVTGVALAIDTHLAGDLSVQRSLRYEGLRLDLARRTFAETVTTVQEWYRTIGITAPGDAPAWVAGASVFEVFIGRAVFWNNHDYAPYPTVQALIDDLDRIEALGMTVIQLMPRHPYPSYNIHDFDDISTSYGPEDELRALVAECHRRGLRVVLDVLLHGVIDGESITTAADRVRSGPIAPLLDRSPGDLFAAGPDEGWRYAVSWSRHILDFEPHWVAGSPAVSPLIAEHPDWFYRDSAGAVSGVYTKAIDVRNDEARRWMLDSLLALAQRLDADGFRLDAPTYNRFANWSPSTRHRAGASTLACLEMFRELRPMMRAWKPDFMLYTEPSGILHRETMDLTYNYDEQWLVGAGLGTQPARASWAVSDGRSMAEWLADRDDFLPPGSLTCHHVDSHDTFWWPEWGEKWRREQFGSGATAAAVAAFALWGGPFMTFVGGEVGIERDLELLAQARRRARALQTGASRADGVIVEDERVFAVVRDDGHDRALVLVNLGDAPAVGRAIVTGGEVGPPHTIIVGAAGGTAALAGGIAQFELPAHGWCVIATTGGD